MTANNQTVYFTKNHEWVNVTGENTVRVGITQYAQQELGDIVFVEIPELDASVTKEEEIATVESVKSASEIYAPVTGTIVAVNDVLEDSPELVNESPLGEGWLADIQMEDKTELEQLMNQAAYDAYVKELKAEEG